MMKKRKKKEKNTLILSDDSMMMLLHGVTSHTFTHTFWTFQQITIIYLHSRHSCFVQTTIYPDKSRYSISRYNSLNNACLIIYSDLFFPSLIYLNYNIKRTIFRKNVYKKYNRAVIMISIKLLVSKDVYKKKKEKNTDRLCKK